MWREDMEVGVSPCYCGLKADSTSLSAALGLWIRMEQRNPAWHLTKEMLLDSVLVRSGLWAATLSPAIQHTGLRTLFVENNKQTKQDYIKVN